MHKGTQSWKNLVNWAYNFFSVPLLFKTLFAPFQMDSLDDPRFTWFEKLAFFIFVRVLGFVFRLVFILCGLIFTLLAVCTYPIFLLLPINLSREYLIKLGSIGAFLSYGNTFFLNKYGRDVLASRRVELFGKEKYLRMILRALGKDTDHNILLVGDVGVGKQVLIDYLGELGASGLSEMGIRHHRVVELFLENMNLENILHALEEAKKSGNVIVVIKNIDRYTSIYEQILPYLKSKSLAIIITVDFAGYDAVLKNHPEFLSKFEKVDIFPPEQSEVLAILKNYIAMRGLVLAESDLKELMRLTDRYIANISEPEKSINIIDALPHTRGPVGLDVIRQVISDKANIPIGALSLDEKAILLSLEENMQSKIIGQDKAVHEVASAMKRMRAGVARPDKPAGSFLFLGPTGVGKTYTAKVLAESYFGRPDAMIRFDMSEFAEAKSLDIFSDRLCAIIEEAPLSLVFFDELEKADRSIHNLLLQVLDEGRLTRANGRSANFREAIIIATSNAGSREIIENINIEKRVLIDHIIDARVFSPEFLNRFSEIVLFKPLSEEDVKKVATLLLNGLAERMQKEKGVELVITPALIEAVTKAGFDPDFGARPINRAIEEIVENKLADIILRGGLPEDKKIVIL